MSDEHNERDPLYTAAREYLAAEDAYQAAADRPIDGVTLDVHGWVRLCDHAKDRVRNAREQLARLLGENDEKRTVTLDVCGVRVPVPRGEVRSCGRRRRKETGEMGLYLKVKLCRGIDYGTREEGAASAWAWWRETEDTETCKVVASLANGGDERYAHLVVCAKAARRWLWGVGHNPSAPDAAVVDVAAWMAQANVAEADAALLAFCEANALPYREPRWLVVTDQS